jgi:hypothetical protein
MSSSLKALFEQAIHPESPYLALLRERGLVRRDLSDEDLRSDLIRGDAVEQALILFAAEKQKDERQQILAALEVASSEQAMEISEFRAFERTAASDEVFRNLERKADNIWGKAVAQTREDALEVTKHVAQAAQAISSKDYDAAQRLLDEAVGEQARVEANFHTTYSEARRGLRREYNATFQSRVWNGTATRHFDTLVNRSVFVPPEEMRNSAQQLAETKQQLISVKSYATELERRVQSRPERSPGPGFRP